MYCATSALRCQLVSLAPAPNTLLDLHQGTHDAGLGL
jgi:hypothetical protein